ncbi:MAG: PspC domain-containing protein [Edaphobacter sp.]
MYCTQCGKQLDPTSRFCSACGATFYAAPPPSAGYPAPGQLTRPRNNRVIAGVCAGLSLHYGWDLTLVRVLTALLAFFTGVGAVAYLIAWVIIPEAPYSIPANTH